MKIFIQIPCFNEEKQIENTIKEIKIQSTQKNTIIKLLL